MTPLHRAITHNNILFVEYLVKKGAKLKCDSHFGGYPLDFAIYLNYFGISDLLLRYKAPSLLSDSYLYEAIKKKNVKMAEYTLKAGAEINRKDYYDNTPLHYASREGDVDMVKLLLQYGSDINVKNRDGKTPSEIAKSKDISILISEWK